MNIRYLYIIGDFKDNRDYKTIRDFKDIRYFKNIKDIKDKLGLSWAELRSDLAWFRLTLLDDFIFLLIGLD